LIVTPHSSSVLQISTYKGPHSGITTVITSQTSSQTYQYLIATSAVTH